MLKKNFCRSIVSGGIRQAAVENFEDLKRLALLDDALWAVNSVPVSALRMNPEFLAFLDTDKDGRIRCDEVRCAVEEVVTRFSDGGGVNNAAGELVIASLNPFAPGGERLIASAKCILAGLNKADAPSLTLEELQQKQLINTFANRNGDGIIIQDEAFSAELNALIGHIVSETGGTADVSGKPGASLDNLQKFLETAAAVLAWRKEPEEHPELLPFGENTAKYTALWQEARPLLTDYFLNADCVDFLQHDDAARLAKRTLTADPLDLSELKNALDKAPLAVPKTREELELKSVNPLHREKIDLLSKVPELQDFFRNDSLSKSNFRKLEAVFAPFLAYQSAKVPGTWFYDAAMTELADLPQSCAVAEFRRAAADDLSYADAVADAATLYKLTLLQKHILEFLNNFVNLTGIFKPGCSSIWQQGELIMDGRRYTLVMPVTDVKSHKAVADGSNICTIYFKINAGTPQEKLLAAAVTDGSMSRLFTGKLGVFFPAGSRTGCDAVITEVLEEPVSFKEAVKEPFRRMGQMIRSRTEKLFAKRSADGEKLADQGVEKFLQTGKTADPVKTQSGMPMLLVGGGIGLAAVGSAVAFIGSTLARLSMWQVLGIALALMLIFGGPPVIISIAKLCNRNLGRFLEASGCAVNLQLKLTPPIARHFTVYPEFRQKFNWISFSLKVLLIVLALLFLGYRFFPQEYRRIGRQTAKCFCLRQANQCAPDKAAVPSEKK